MKTFSQTPSQTVGPFFAYSLAAEQYGYDFNSVITGALGDFSFAKNSKGTLINAADEAPVERYPIYITGKIFDGAGKVVPDAVVELWHADENGQYRTSEIRGKNDGFTGFGRLGTGTDPERRFVFTTVKPGAVEGQAPHINVVIFMRGLLLHLYTRLYFSDETEANQQDELLSSVPEERRHTLVAQRIESNGSAWYEFDVHLQGEEETVFLDI